MESFKKAFLLVLANNMDSKTNLSLFTYDIYFGHVWVFF